MARTESDILDSLLVMAPRFITRDRFGVIILKMIARIGRVAEETWESFSLWALGSTSTGDTLDDHLDNRGLPPREPWESDADVQARLAMQSDSPTPERWRDEFERVIQPVGYEIGVHETALQFFDLEDYDDGFFWDLHYLKEEGDAASLIVVEVPLGIEVVQANTQYFDVDGADADAYFYDVHYLDPLPEDLEREPYNRIVDFVQTIRPHATLVRVIFTNITQPIHLAALIMSRYRGGPILTR